MVAPGCTKRLPPSDSTRPAAIFKSVDLPEPLRPIRQTRSPADTDSSTPDNSGVPPKVSLMSFNWIRGGAMSSQFNSVFALKSDSSDFSLVLFEHDLFGKPVPTFPDHA